MDIVSWATLFLESPDTKGAFVISENLARFSSPSHEKAKRVEDWKGMLGVRLEWAASSGQEKPGAARYSELVNPRYLTGYVKM